jgi:hypothetical protein
MNRQSDLLQIIPALHSPCSLSRLLHCWQQQGEQYRNDSDHDEQFDQCESAFAT